MFLELSNRACHLFSYTCNLLAMKNDSVRKYIALRESLQKDKVMLEERLSQINRALSGGGSSGPAPKQMSAPSAKKRRSRKNKMSLKAAVAEVTKAKALTKPEILTAIDKLGYQFSAPNPINSLNTVLYSNRQFKNVKGWFSPA
ncbi:MAG: hypothetical protein O2960_13735 [Verrucomicrobia bacterium]|nr:hypothetical protein [Verrucomicrobiota bacterium]